MAYSVELISKKYRFLFGMLPNIYYGLGYVALTISAYFTQSWAEVKISEKIYLKKNSILAKNFDFFQKIQFFIKISIFAKNFDFCQKIQFFIKISIEKKRINFG